MGIFHFWRKWKFPPFRILFSLNNLFTAASPHSQGTADPPSDSCILPPIDRANTVFTSGGFLLRRGARNLFSGGNQSITPVITKLKSPPSHWSRNSHRSPRVLPTEILWRYFETLQFLTQWSSVSVHYRHRWSGFLAESWGICYYFGWSMLLVKGTIRDSISSSGTLSSIYFHSLSLWNRSVLLSFFYLGFYTPPFGIISIAHCAWILLAITSYILILRTPSKVVS